MDKNEVSQPAGARPDEKPEVAAVSGLRAALPLAAVCVLIAFSVYFSVLHHEFVYDDDELVLGNAAIRNLSAGGALELFRQRDYANFLPLRMLSYAVDYRAWEYNPVGYHLTNIFLHGMNTALVFMLVFLLAARSGLRTAGTRAAAFAAAFFFAVHPLHVEAVTWISGRKEVLYSFFFLSALLLHARRRFAEGQPRGALGFTGVLLLMIAAQLSKGTAVAFPFAALLFDILFVERNAGRPRVRRVEHAILFAVTGVVIFINLRMAAGENTYFGLFGGGAASHALTSIKIAPFYLMKTLWPAGLSVEYGVPVSRSPAEPAVIASLLVAAAGSVAVAHLWRRVPAAAFGLLFFVTALLPVLNIIPFGVFAADRYAYLALAGPCMVAGLAAGWCAERGFAARAGAFALVAVAAAALAYTTHVRNADWTDDITLWESAVETYPEVAKARDGLGRAYMDTNRLTYAETQFKKALELDPAYINAYTNLGILLVKAGRAGEALEILNAGLIRNPGDIGLLYSRSAACLTLGQYECAARDLAAVRSVDPGYMLTERMFPLILQRLKESVPPAEYEKIMRETGM